MNTTIRTYDPTAPQGFPGGLPARNYRMRCHLSGQAYGTPMERQSPFIAGNWWHKDWLDVMTRVKRMADIASSMAKGPITVQTTMIKGGGYHRTWIFQDEWGREESLHVWIIPDESA